MRSFSCFLPAPKSYKQPHQEIFRYERPSRRMTEGLWRQLSSYRLALQALQSEFEPTFKNPGTAMSSWKSMLWKQIQADSWTSVVRQINLSRKIPANEKICFLKCVYEAPEEKHPGLTSSLHIHIPAHILTYTNVGFTSCLVTVLLFWGETMNKATYRRQPIIRDLLTVAEGASLTVMTGSTAADMKAWCWSSSWQLQHSDSQTQGQEREIGHVCAFETLMITPTDTISTRTHLPSNLQITSLTPLCTYCLKMVWNSKTSWVLFLLTKIQIN